MLFFGAHDQFPGNQLWIGRGRRRNSCGIHKGGKGNKFFLSVCVRFSFRVLSTIVALVEYCANKKNNLETKKKKLSHNFFEDVKN